MFNVEGYTINLSRGDTGALKVKATATLNGEPFTFGSDDRALFSIKNAQTGEVVKEKIAEMDNNEFTVFFLNADTDALSPGNYQWDVRYVINPYWKDGRIVDGDQVITPKEPQNMQLITVVGDI